jgi:hypothetical protein
MKKNQDFRHRLNMGRVAKPILEVFLSDSSPIEKRKILRKILGKTRAMPELMRQTLIEDALVNGEFTVAYVNPVTGNINFLGLDKKPGTYGHELMHGLKRHVRNDYVLASAVEGYINLISRIMDNQTINLFPVFFPENLRPLGFFERTFPWTEYTHNFDATGKDLGQRAAFIESQTKIPGSGLFYLKLADDGISLGDAETRIRKGEVSGMKEFGERYGNSFYRTLVRTNETGVVK